MNLVGIFLTGVIAGGVVFGTALGFLGYELGHAGEPIVTVRNLRQSPTHVRIQTDIGESYSLNDIQPGGSARTRISGRDQALWVEATTSTGEQRKSEQVYVTSHGTVFVAVTEQSITIDYDL
jgi:hypothetical protein